MQPIDLQTIYTQLDKIGKSQVQQQLSAQTAQESQIAANKLKTEQKLKKVQEMEAGNDHVGLVHEKDDSGSETEAETQMHTKTGDNLKTEEETEKEIITDPTLGIHIDISG